LSQIQYDVDRCWTEYVAILLICFYCATLLVRCML